MAAIDVIEKSAALNRDQALLIEHAAFAKLAKTSAATSLVGLFLNDQYLKKSAKTASKTADKVISKAAVLGAGIMGGGIAYQSAVKGIPIVMKDIREDALDLGMATASKILNKGVSLWKVSVPKMIETLSRIKPTLNYEDIKGADIIIEAVIENPAIKDSVLQETEALIDENTILTSNTSTISIDLLATNLKRPEKFCGMHFFNPVHKMKLVEDFDQLEKLGGLSLNEFMKHFKINSLMDHSLRSTLIGLLVGIVVTSTVFVLFIGGKM